MEGTVKLSVDEVNELLQLVPEARLLGDRTSQVREGIRLLLARERIRQSGLDGLTGMKTHESLVCGELISQAHSVTDTLDHAGPLDVRLGAFGVRIAGLANINATHGYAIGDVVVCSVAGCLAAASSGSPVVRLAGDTFAALIFAPGLAQPDFPEALENLEGAVVAAVGSTEPDEKLSSDVKLTTACLDLSVVSPFDLRVAGTIVSAEIRRALVVAEARPETAVQVRRVELGERISG